jgi:hypothetical protein
MNDHGYVPFVVVIVEPSILSGKTKHIHVHSLPHRILGSPMTKTNQTYP